MILKRSVTTVVLFPLLVLVILKGSNFLLLFLLYLTCIRCFYEWSKLLDFSNFWTYLGYFIITTFFGFHFLKNFSSYFYFYFFFLVSFFPFLFRYEPDNFKRTFFFFYVGLIYIFIGLYPLYEMILEFKREFMLYLFFIVFANDTGAYITGSLIGKHFFVPKISPKKTWEGFFGGIFFGVFVGILVNYWFNIFDFWINILISIVLCLTGVIGDLFESSVKRMVGKKDSGKLIWGHGGLLDRIDGLMFASPCYFMILKSFPGMIM